MINVSFVFELVCLNCMSYFRIMSAFSVVYGFQFISSLIKDNISAQYFSTAEIILKIPPLLCQYH